MEFPEARIAIFCKAPVPGRVKTRLAKRIGDVCAAQLHEALAHHCLQMLAVSSVAPVQLWCAPEIDHRFFHECREMYGVELHEQVGADLGAKMLQAFEHAHSEERQCVVVGTDCPALDVGLVREALGALNAGADGVISPAEDGGYVLLGLARPMPAVFSDISWGSHEVLAQTRLRMVGHWRELTTLWDIDRLEDLQRLRDSAQGLRLDGRLMSLLDKLDYSQR